MKRAVHNITSSSSTSLPKLIYTIDQNQLDQDNRNKWKQLNLDSETQVFLDGCQPSFFKDSMAMFLRTFVSRTDANGMVGRGKMFVLSKNQLETVCPEVLNVKDGKLLDIGSGDGSITERYTSYFSEIVTTETSSVMANRLRSRGWVCFEPPDQPNPQTEEEKFDIITCYNVLDRADKPVSLLKMLKSQMKSSSGRLVLAVVLPWCPFVEDGTGQRKPSETLPMEGCCCKDRASFEKSLNALCNNVIKNLGFEIISISRIPYISEGDQNCPYYVLSDAIIVCKIAQ